MSTSGGQQSDPDSASFVSEPVSVSSSASGGGPPADPSSATPGGEAHTTPPTTPCGGVTHLEGKKTSSIETQTESYCVNAFSSKTCLELLIDDKLTSEQLQFEHNYLSSLSHGRQARIKENLGKSMHTHIVKEIRTKLITSACIDFDTAINKQSLILDNFSCLVEEAQAQVDKLVALNTAAKVWPPANSGVPEPEPEDIGGDWLVVNPEDDGDDQGETSLPSTVCDLTCGFITEIHLSDVLDQIPITGPSSGGRVLAYFGAKGYTYGKVHHEPKEYPDCEVMNQVISKLKSLDDSFNTDDFSCLVTKYPDGRATIPAHSDDETQIKADSKIFTVSFGASRELEFVRRTGALQEHRVNVPHGSLYTMTAQSQKDWSHELLYDTSVTSPRVSFTFRHMVDPPSKTPAPPLAKSAPPKPRHSEKQKILFLTDSVLNSTPEYLFNKVRHHRCIKKRNYYFTDLADFEHDFKHSRIVVLSMGINDMSTGSEGRPQMSGDGLADWVSCKLRAYCNKYRNTTFVVNSVLHSRHHWLNSEVDTFNCTIRRLAGTIPNLDFVDTHSVIMHDGISSRLDFVLERSDPRGTHLTLAAKRLVAGALVQACHQLANGTAGLPSGRDMNWVRSGGRYFSTKSFR